MSPSVAKPVILSTLLGCLLVAIACFAPPKPEPVERAEPEARPTRVRESIDGGDPPKAGRSQTLDMTVGPARKECYGPFRRMCLIVDGSFFYDEIDGFTHEPGYQYRLRVERYDAYPGQKEPPQDAGRYGYRLLEMISKDRVSGEVREAAVAPARVQCPKSDEVCLLLDGKPTRGSIAGFDYEPGHDYRIRYERFHDGSRVLQEVVSRAEATGIVEEITVGPWRVQCYQDAPITAACIVVNGEPFYGTIEGFPRRHGDEYTLRVEKYDLLPDVDTAPAETAKYSYRLLKILSEQPASQPPSAN